VLVEQEEHQLLLVPFTRVVAEVVYLVMVVSLQELADQVEAHQDLEARSMPMQMNILEMQPLKIPAAVVEASDVQAALFAEVQAGQESLSSST
jgi:hypothetical protein